MQDDIWASFFGNPLLKKYIEEAENNEPQQSEAEPGEMSTDIDGLTKDFSDGHITQDDLINMYKSGKISQEDVQRIISNIEDGGPDASNGQMNQDEEGPTEEELFAQQMDQTNDMFIKFSVYDKINELSEKLDYFKENFEDTNSDIYTEVIQLREFLNILSNLVFNIETSVAYQMYGSILLQLTELFNQYNNITVTNEK